MDPDAALADAREALARIDAFGVKHLDVEEMDSASMDVTVAFRVLDEWITKGGFLPEAWASTVGALPAHVHDLPDEPSPEAIQRLVDAAPDLNPTALARLAKVCRQLEAALHAEGEDELRAWLRTMYRTALQNDDAIDAETGLPGP